MSSVNGETAQSKRIFGWTGGEDGCLCYQLSDNSAGVNRSQMSSTLVMKSLTTRKKNWHHPHQKEFFFWQFMLYSRSHVEFWWDLDQTYW